MALVNTDLFLVQDASTKTNYRISYANLAADISADIVDDIDFKTEYVNINGDNMTGDLTLGPVGTTNITFNAATGNGTFTGTVYADYVKAGTSVLGFGGLLLYGDTSSTLGIELKTNGDVNFGADADFVGDVTASAFIGDGSGLTNLPVMPTFWVESGNNLSPITSGRNLTNISDITISGDFQASGNLDAVDITAAGDISGVNAVFTGTLEAASIDGGTYS
jgi:hypothetical protein